METTKEKTEEIIKKFMDQAAWAEKVELGRVLNQFWMGSDEKNNALYCPVHHSLVWNLATNSRFKGAAQMMYREPWLLVWGDPDDAQTEEIIYKMAKYNHLIKVPINRDLVDVKFCFVDAQAQLFYARYICRLFDGMDMDRTYQNLLKGEMQPIMEWDR